uniref:DNA helicase Pif1-like 2B domain-containing protein n=1 Tax=Salix viminalis TaxID=40686 RepID=A0A6N2LSK5_SALVM
MINRFCFEALDCSMRDVILEGDNYNNDLPFCGKTILLGENIRLSTNGLTFEEKANIHEFSKWTLSVGNGYMSDLPSLSEPDDYFVVVPSNLLFQPSCDPISAIVSTIYPNISEAQVDPYYFRERAIVTTKNIIVDEINDFVFRITPGEKRVYLGIDSISTSSIESDNASSLYPLEYINQLEFNGAPSHTLALKIGTPATLLRNVSPSIGLCNGTRLIITQLSSKVMALSIQSIKKYNFYAYLNGRVCRVWIPKINGQTDSFNCLLVDGKGNAIQASAKGNNIQSFANSIIEGDYYQISGF